MSHKYAVAMELEVEGDSDSMAVAAQIAGDLSPIPGYRFFNLSVEQDFEDGEVPVGERVSPI